MAMRETNVANSWGPIRWSLRNASPEDRTWVDASFRSSIPANWAGNAPVEDVTISLVRDSHLLDFYRHARPIGEPVWIRRAWYRHVPTAGRDAWVRCDGQVCDFSDLGLPKHVFVAEPGGGWEIVMEDRASARNGSRLAETLLRFVLVTRLVRHGGIELLGSAAVHHSVGAIVFLGSSSAGRTRLALQVAGSGGRFISGDHTLLAQAAHGWYAVGSGLPVRLERDVLRAAPAADVPLLWYDGQTFRSLLDQGASAVTVAGRELRDVLAVETTDANRLAHIVHVVRHSSGNAAVGPASDENKCALLAGFTLDPEVGWLPSANELTTASKKDLRSSLDMSILHWNPLADSESDVAALLIDYLTALR